MTNRLARLFARLSDRPDSEHEQAAIRIVIVLVAGAYISIAVLADGTIDAAESRTLALAALVATLALLLFAAIVRSPEVSPPRRLCGMAVDIGATCCVLLWVPHLGGPLWVVLLWVIIGNGFRFGVRYLAAATAMSLVGFAAVAAAEPYWRREANILAGLLLGLVVIPAYVAALLRRLTRALEQARAAGESKGRFLANMSHEIRTPLTGIIGTVDLLRATDLTERQRRLVGSLSLSSGGLLEILNDVLDYSKIQAGQLTLAAEDFEPRELLSQVADLFEATVGAKGISLGVAVDEGVPKVVRGDRVRLRQVLVNLVGNAVKFTERGGVTVRLTCPARHGGDATLRFEVSDTGAGIDPDAHERIFQPFTQTDDSATRAHGGTGLGLAISRAIVQAMGGRISVESRPDAGSTFRVEAPFAEAAGDAAPAVVASPHPAAAPPAPPAPPGAPAPGATAALPSGGAPRILLAEDQAMLRSMFTELFASLGRGVETVNNGREAVEAFAPGRYALIFMDCQMPEMDGFRATEEIRRLEGGGPRTPIVALTAHALEGDRERCFAAGMDDYLGKPFRLNDLRSTLERWLPAP